MPINLPFLTISSGGLDEFLLMSGETNPLRRSTDWLPQVAVENDSEVGNNPLYTDVEENMSFNYRATVVASGYAVMQKLERMLSNAERWSDGENVNPTIVKFQPKGSALSVPLHAVITGRTDKTKSSTQLNDYLKAGTWKGLLNQNISFIRRGQWHTTREDSTTSSAQATGNVHTLTFPSASPDYVPVDIVLSANRENFTASTALFIAASTLNNAIEAIDPSSATATTYTSVVDAGTQPSNNLLRYTPTNTNFRQSGLISLSAATANKINPNSLIHIYATVRNNSGSVEWLVKAQYSTGSIGSYPLSSPTVIDNSYTNPRAVYLATLSPGTNARVFTTNGFYLYIQASTAASSLDIEKIYVLIENDKAVNVLYTPVDATSMFGVFNYAHGGNFSIAIKSNPLIHYVPTVTTYKTANELAMFNLDMRGDKWLNHTGTTYAVLPVLTGFSTYWRLYDSTAAAIVNFTAKATRYNSYLVPE